MLIFIPVMEHYIQHFYRDFITGELMNMEDQWKIDADFWLKQLEK